MVSRIYSSADGAADVPLRLIATRRCPAPIREVFFEQARTWTGVGGSVDRSFDLCVIRESDGALPVATSAIRPKPYQCDPSGSRMFRAVIEPRHSIRRAPNGVR